MKRYEYDAVVVGGGAAGMAAALEIEAGGHSVALVEREEQLGGILLQCIHNGFGLHRFKEELTGPEYAERYLDQVSERPIEQYLQTTVVSMNCEGPFKELACYSSLHGVFMLAARCVVLAMGCRERNRGNIGIPGSRPAGIFTAGLAQRLINIEGHVPGQEAVIVGSGDIGLIMARRLSWSGVKVKAVIEIMPYPSGLTRNIVQCLNDFGIPLYLSHVVSKIYGRKRISGIDVTPLDNGRADNDNGFHIDCDTLLLSVGLVPENELSKRAGIELHPQTAGPVVDAALMTSVPGVFACGNVLHVHDLVDYVSEESARAGSFAIDYLRGQRTVEQYRVKSGSNCRYVMPGAIDPERENTLYIRSLVVKSKATLELRWDNQVIKRVPKRHVMPSEMISLTLSAKDLDGLPRRSDSALTISIA